jgi:hypothetical protein
MTISKTRTSQLPLARTGLLLPARVIAALKLMRDVFVEAQAMAQQAKRRYPFVE